MSRKCGQKALETPETDRLQTLPFISEEDTCHITLSDERASLVVIGRRDDGSDESLESPCIAEASVLKGIGRMKLVDPVTVLVAIRQGDTAQKFTYS